MRTKISACWPRTAGVSESDQGKRWGCYQPNPSIKAGIIMEVVMTQQLCPQPQGLHAIQPPSVCLSIRKYSSHSRTF